MWGSTGISGEGMKVDPGLAHNKDIWRHFCVHVFCCWRFLCINIKTEIFQILLDLSFMGNSLQVWQSVHTHKHENTLFKWWNRKITVGGSRKFYFITHQRESKCSEVCLCMCMPTVGTGSLQVWYDPEDVVHQIRSLLVLQDAPRWRVGRVYVGEVRQVHPWNTEDRECVSDTLLFNLHMRTQSIWCHITRIHTHTKDALLLQLIITHRWLRSQIQSLLSLHESKMIINPWTHTYKDTHTHTQRNTHTHKDTHWVSHYININIERQTQQHISHRAPPLNVSLTRQSLIQYRWKKSYRTVHYITPTPPFFSPKPLTHTRTHMHKQTRTHTMHVFT